MVGPWDNWGYGMKICTHTVFNMNWRYIQSMSRQWAKFFAGTVILEARVNTIVRGRMYERFNISENANYYGEIINYVARIPSSFRISFFSLFSLRLLPSSSRVSLPTRSFPSFSLVPLCALLFLSFSFTVAFFCCVNYAKDSHESRMPLKIMNYGRVSRRLF